MKSMDTPTKKSWR